MFLTIAIALVVLAVFALLSYGWQLLQAKRAEKRRAANEHQLRQMKFAAGIRPGMPRKQRRLRGRLFAKHMERLARSSGTTAGMPRHEVKRRTKQLAKLVANGVQ